MGSPWSRKGKVGVGGERDVRPLQALDRWREGLGHPHLPAAPTVALHRQSCLLQPELISCRPTATRGSTPGSSDEGSSA